MNRKNDLRSEGGYLTDKQNARDTDLVTRRVSEGLRPIGILVRFFADASGYRFFLHRTTRTQPFWKRLLSEIATGEMPMLTRAQHKRGFQYSPWLRFHADQDGKISYVSVFTILAIIMFIGLIMNTTVSVKEKIEMQNAADAAAYSSTLWMARSMNTVTAVNHLMGEQTALLTIIDGFGGPMLGNEDEKEFEESRILNERLESVRASENTPSPAATKDSDIGKILHGIDKVVVNKVYDFMVEDKGRHKGGAAVYDSKIRLKQLCEQIFYAKVIVNGGMRVAGKIEKTPYAAVGYAIDGICSVLHVELSKQLAELAKERKMLDLAETIVEKINSKRAVFKAVEGLCRALTIYTDALAGGKTSSKSDRLNRSIAQTIQVIETEHRITTFEMNPAIEKIELPIRGEEPAIGKQLKQTAPTEFGAWQHPAMGWSGNFGNKSDVEKIFRQILNATKSLKPILSTLKTAMKWLSSFADAKLPIPEKYKKFFSNGKDWIKDIEALLALGDLKKPLDRDGSVNNPCLGNQIGEEYRLPKFYWEAERESQWVRATYPYVDDYRTGLLHLMKKHLPRSNMATYYANWTNRYTLANSFLMRKDDTERKSDSNANTVEKLKSKVRELRRRFDDALETSDEEAVGNLGVAPFEDISDDLLEFVQRISVPAAFESWKQKVLAHQGKARDAGNSLSPTPADDITDEDLKALGTQVARINLLDELLTLLEELIDALEINPPHMYIMKYMDGKNKGIEPWTSDSKLAGKLFCIQATAKRSGQKIFMSPVFFSQHLADERNTVSEAMLYNANGRSVQAKPDWRFQANTGWDTLNWELPVQAFEWGKHEPSVASVSATDIFTNGKAVRRNARSKINWQSKLTPIQSKPASSNGRDFNH